MVVVDGFQYEVIEDVRDGFKEEDFIARYTDILARYDYIVGDWGYGQLRLKGFFDDKNTKATYDTKISTFEDYLYEYCNFGCAYFILKKQGKVEQEVSNGVLANDAVIDDESVIDTEIDEFIDVEL